MYKTLAIAAATLTASGALGSPIGYESFRHGPAKYHVVTADLSSGRIRARTVHSPRLTSVWSLISQQQPTAAITGTFFSPGSGHPVADLLVDGRLVANGSRGSGIAVDWTGGVRIFDANYQHRMEWADYQWGLRGAIRVVHAGKVQPNPQAQHFTDRRLWGKAARTGVGLTENGKLVLVATTGQVTLSELGRAMVARGVRDGLSLDGGSSTCLYYRGSLVVPPGRKLSNLFVLSEAPPYWSGLGGGNISLNHPER
jgi:exopolysaccharide biosynthesis protein